MKINEALQQGYSVKVWRSYVINGKAYLNIRVEKGSCVGLSQVEVDMLDLGEDDVAMQILDIQLATAVKACAKAQEEESIYLYGHGKPENKYV